MSLNARWVDSSHKTRRRDDISLGNVVQLTVDVNLSDDVSMPLANSNGLRHRENCPHSMSDVATAKLGRVPVDPALILSATNRCLQDTCYPTEAECLADYGMRITYKP